MEKEFAYDFSKETSTNAPLLQDGSTLLHVRTKAPWGVATIIGDEGYSLRIFDYDAVNAKGVDMSKPALLDEISHNHHTLKLPQNLDADDLAINMLQRLYTHGARTSAHINRHATLMMLDLYGVPMSTAIEISHRKDYVADVLPMLEKAFPDEDPAAFAKKKPSMQELVLGNLVRDLGSMDTITVREPDEPQATSSGRGPFVNATVSHLRT
ncbi:MAG TPA: hypothetical protein VIN59_02150 [Alphaproteobacteria bacterium]